VLCVEAAPSNVRLLQAGAARNGFDQVLVVHGAATDYEGTVGFLPNGPWGTIVNPAVARAPSLIQARWLAPVTVPAVTVDALLARLGWDRIDLVKIDVEGSEVAALRGMADLLSRPDAPILLYESNADALPMFGETPASLAAALVQLGYSSYLVEPGRLVPTQLDDFRSECVVSYLAVKGQPPALAGWQVTGPQSHEEMVRRVLSQSSSPLAYERAHLARVLAEAGGAILADRRVKLVLGMLADDPEAKVRTAAAWYLAPRSGREGAAVRGR
jgi:FkbM family methyltransferase